MIQPVSAGGADRPEEKLWRAAQQLEGVFAQHLTKALRSTVPKGGSPDAPGADLYGSLLDEHLAEVVTQDTRTGLAEALYRQLTGSAPPTVPEMAIARSEATVNEGSET